jgi:hypothetical protein
VPGPRGVLGPDGLYFDGSVGGGADALGRCASVTTRSRAQLCEAQRARAQREFSVEAIAAVYRGLLNTDALHPADAS